MQNLQLTYIDFLIIVQLVQAQKTIFGKYAMSKKLIDKMIQV